jgi:hypothetical protein
MAAEKSQLFGRPDIDRPVYFISGHGSEHRGVFEIPYGCDIIVKNDTCTFAKSTELNYMLNALLFMSQRVIRNPIGNMNELIRMLGSVAVYTRDPPRIDEHHANFRYHRNTPRTCPNFQYQLLNHVFKQNEDGKYISIDNSTGSGITDVARLREARRGIQYTPHIRMVVYAPDTPKGIEAARHNKNDNIQLIVSFFQYSIYPKPNTIQTYLTGRWREEEQVELYDMLIDLDHQYYLTTVSQEFLCYFFPGVYYHNVCRGIERNLGETARQYETTQRYVKELNNWREGVGEKKVSVLAANPIFSKRLFEEAALRRNYLHQYQGSVEFEEGQHVMNMSNCRNLQTRIASVEERLAAVNQSNASNEVKAREKEKIIKNTRVKLLRKILHDKRTQCARRDARTREGRARESAARAASAAASVSRYITQPQSNTRRGRRSRVSNRNQTRRGRNKGPNRSRNGSSNRSRSKSPTQNNSKNNN